MRIRVAHHLQEGIHHAGDVEVVVLCVLQSQACILSQRQKLACPRVEPRTIEKLLFVSYSTVGTLIFSAISIRSEVEVDLHVDWQHHPRRRFPFGVEPFNVSCWGSSRSIQKVLWSCGTDIDAGCRDLLECLSGISVAEKVDEVVIVHYVFIFWRPPFSRKARIVQLSASCSMQPE